MFRIIPTYIDILKSFLKIYMQGTYLDTILPRADLPENQAAMPEIGQRVRLSRGDILQTTALYQCPGCGKTYQVPGGEKRKIFHNIVFISGNCSKVWLSSAQRTLLLSLRLGPATLQEGRQVRVADPRHPRREDHPQRHQPRHPGQCQLSARLP